MTESIFDTEFAQLVYYPDKQIIHHTVLRPVEGEDFRQVLETGLDFMAQRGVSKWLSDDRKMAGFPANDARWALEDWLPRAAGAGWKYWALVVPDVVSARADYMPLIQTTHEANVRINLFSDIAAAIDWLESQV